MSDFVMDDYLDLMDDILEKSKPIFGSKKCMIDADQLRDCIDHIRMSMPDEIKQSKKIVNERKSIIDEANKQAEEIVTRAETRANALVANHEIVKAAEAKAAEKEAVEERAEKSGLFANAKGGAEAIKKLKVDNEE